MSGRCSGLREPWWNPLPEPLDPGVPSRADGTSPYLAVDNRAERIGEPTVADGKVLVKRDFGNSQGYPPNSSEIHSTGRVHPQVVHTSSTCRPRVTSNRRESGRLVDGGADSRLTNEVMNVFRNSTIIIIR